MIEIIPNYLTLIYDWSENKKTYKFAYLRTCETKIKVKIHFSLIYFMLSFIL